MGYARRPEVVEKFKSMGGEAASSLKEAAQKAETVIVLVLNDSQVLEVVTGPNGILEGTGKIRWRSALMRVLELMSESDK